MSAMTDIPLADRLWTREEVAEFLRYKPRSLEKIAAKPGFPAPHRRSKPTVWLAGDIIEYARTHQK